MSDRGFYSCKACKSAVRVDADASVMEMFGFNQGTGKHRCGADFQEVDPDEAFEELLHPSSEMN